MQPLHAATDRLGVDVCLAKNLGSGPSCPHGPMLLLERFYKDSRPPRRFYGCSAARDRKDCSFFQWEDEKISEVRAKAHREIIEAFKNPFLQACDIYMNLLQSSNFKKLKCSFCHTCGLLLLLKHEERHQGHDVEQVEDLSKPTKILKPKENERTQAQYLFSNKSSHFLISLIKDIGFKNVLCLGTPRLHEEIQFMANAGGDEKRALDSLLLDIDYRYAQFFPSSNFCWYNMFNHHFFGSLTSEKTLSTFLQREALVLVMDPPFGGLAEVLAATVSKIWTTWREKSHTDAVAGDQDKELPTMWIFPYFMESHIKKSLPSLTMMDYKVDYDNHPHFKSRSLKGSKRGSPVRIFTNIIPSKIVLPAGEGYRFCKSCNRYVASENVHCTKCNGCMSKDGRQYVHCDMCETCVKPGRQHCFSCRRCETQEHRCDGPVNNGCHICGKVGHKRRECPNRTVEPAKKRRKKAEGVKLSHRSTTQVHTQKRNAKMNGKTKKMK